MGFDLAVWYEPAAVTHEHAAATYELLRHGKDAGLTNHHNLSTFFVDLISQFPRTGGLSETDVGRRAWSVDPEVEGNGLLLSLSWANASELAPRIKHLAERHGLVCYDPHVGQVQLPRPLASPLLQLSGDGLVSIIEPSTDEVRRVVARLGDPHAHLTLQRFAQQYVQAALRSTTGMFAVEYRDGTADLHFQGNTKDIAAVVDIFVGFAQDAEEWKRRYRWRRWP
jgi:hypothetical protein